jgi:hypothetical protein
LAVAAKKKSQEAENKQTKGESSTSSKIKKIDLKSL